MLNVSRLSCVWSVLFCLLAALAVPTAKAQSPALSQQLDRVDFSVNGIGEFNGSGSGTPKSGPVDQNGQPLTVNLQTGNTLGALVTVRYIKSPLVGFEGNYSYARYTETFTPFGSPTTGGARHRGVQTNADEYTLGYVVHTPKFLDVQPFVSAGLGTIAFRPTTFGGQSLREQARVAYYYSIGVGRRHLAPLRPPRPVPPGLLPRPGLRPELPDHPAPHLDLRARHRLLHPLLRHWLNAQARDL